MLILIHIGSTKQHGKQAELGPKECARRANRFAISSNKHIIIRDKHSKAAKHTKAAISSGTRQGQLML
jgi:hypothetical protein